MIVKVLELKKKTVTPLKMALICGILISIADLPIRPDLTVWNRQGSAADTDFFIRRNCGIFYGFCV